MFYPEDFKDVLRESISIVDVINQTGGQLIPHGSGYLMSCPFHEDKNPSMGVHPHDNYFQCFSCGAGTRYHSHVKSSDIFSYVMGLNNMNMYEAVDWLSKTFSIYPPQEKQTPEENYKAQARQWWSQITKSSADRFMSNLLNDNKAYYYVRGRGFEDIDIEYWQIGLGDKQQVEFKHSDGKITFPIKDYNGHIVSFVARVPLSKEELFHLNDQEREQGKRVTPKYEHRWKLKPTDVNETYYKNHPQKSFSRKEHLYGIFEAKEKIRRYGKAIVVEGFTDVISLHRHNISHSVSTMGLRLSEEHLKLLKKAGARTITLMRDGDSSGLKAIEQDARMLKDYGFEVNVCPMPNDHDPDSLSRVFSIASDDYARFIHNSTKTVPEWKVESVYKKDMEDILLYNNKIHALRVNQIDSVVSALKEEEDLIERDLLTHQYAQLFNLSPDTLKEYIEKEITL